VLSSLQEDAHFQSRQSFKQETGHYPDDVGLMQINLFNRSGEELTGIARTTSTAPQDGASVGGNDLESPRSVPADRAEPIAREANMLYETERAIIWKKPIMTPSRHIFPQQGELVYDLAVKKGARLLGFGNGCRYPSKKKIIGIYDEEGIAQALGKKEDKLDTQRRSRSYAETLVGESPSGKSCSSAARVPLPLEDWPSRPDGHSSVTSVEGAGHCDVAASPSRKKREAQSVLSVDVAIKSRSRSRSREVGVVLTGLAESDEEARVKPPGYWHKVLGPKAMFAEGGWKHAKKQIGFAKKCVSRIFATDSLEASRSP
jgi:hypothetical protein